MPISMPGKDRKDEDKSERKSPSEQSQPSQSRSANKVPDPDPLTMPGTERTFVDRSDPGPHSSPGALPRPEDDNRPAMVEPSQDKEAIAKGKEHLERRRKAHEEGTKSGTLSGEAAGDINRHAPSGPIVGEVLKDRASLQPRSSLAHQRGTREQDHQPKPPSEKGA